MCVPQWWLLAGLLGWTGGFRATTDMFHWTAQEGIRLEFAIDDSGRPLRTFRYYVRADQAASVLELVLLYVLLAWV